MQWVGVDVGGTFTDVVLYDEDRGTLTVGKSPTSPSDPTVGLLRALAKLDVALSATGRVVHGTTIGTNAILERKGAAVWMLTTRGFRDTLEIARTNRTVLYDIRARKPAPLVAREHIVEIDERVAFDGSVVRPLRDDDLRAALTAIRESANGGAAALVVGFLHSYANPAHERAAAHVAAELLPGCFIVASTDVLPEFREYERFSTAALNAYIGPNVGGYLRRLGTALGERGYAGRVFITTSSGGIVPAAVAARFPVHTVLSGPAGGVAAAVNLGRVTGARNLITYDMGGTSTDVCLIEDLEPVLTTEQHIGGLPNRTPQIEINSIGAGGGSVAWIDEGGALRVVRAARAPIPVRRLAGAGRRRPSRTPISSSAASATTCRSPARSRSTRRARGGRWRRCCRACPACPTRRRWPKASSGSRWRRWSGPSRRSPSPRAMTRATSRSSPTAVPAPYTRRSSPRSWRCRA
jgi:N-methylhydantoinase A